MTFAPYDQYVSTGVNEDDLISLDAILLLGCLSCYGSSSKKAEVFTRIIAPEIDPHITAADKDFYKAITFMICLAISIEQLKKDLQAGKVAEVDYEKIKKVL